MDLIFTNAAGEDVGVILKYTLDLAYGSEENDFQLETGIGEIEANAFIYIEGTEFGGIIDGLKVDTEKQTVNYIGRSFHGILNSYIIQPPSGEAYMVVSGEANAVLTSIIATLGIADLFEVSTEDSGITIPSTNIDRYIKGYDGINKVLKANGAKLGMAFLDGKIHLEVKPVVNYAEDEQYSSDHYKFTIQKHINQVNHLICLGSGELTERQVVHLYVQEDGSISTENQFFTGTDEYVDTFDDSNAESIEELEKFGRERLQELWNNDKAEMKLFDDETVLDINDIVGATEEITRTTITNRVLKKIIKIKDNEINIEYKVGD